MTARAVRHEHSTVTDASPEAAWRLACDVSRYAEWVGVTLAVLDPVPPEAVVGATYRERTRVAGPITTVATWTVVQRDDASLVQRHECRDDSGPVRAMWIEMRVDAEGSTRVTLAIGCEVAAGPLSRPLGWLLSRRLGAENARNLQRFAGLLASPDRRGAG